MRILVTGASGLCASAIARKLVAGGHEVHASYRSKAPELPTGMAFHGTYQGSLAERKTFSAFPKQIDAVVHAAAALNDPATPVRKFVEDNVIATHNVIDYALAAGARKFVYLSSVSVSGKVSQSRYDEATPIVDPDPYGYTKRLGELLLNDARDRLASVSLRLPGIIGDGGFPNWLMDLARRLAAGGKVSIHHPDHRFNNAVHVDDLADFCAGYLSRDHDGAHLLTLGASEPMTVRDIVETLAEGLGSTSEIDIVESDQEPFAIDDSAARDKFDYRSKTMEKIIDFLISLHKKN